MRILLCSLIVLTSSYINARPQSGFISYNAYIGSGDQRLEEMATTAAKALYKDEKAIDTTSPLGVVTDEEGKKFLRIKVKDDGDCFAYAIGTTRSEIVRSLESFIDSIEKSSAKSSSTALLPPFSAIFSFLHKHPTITTIGDLESILSYDFPVLKIRLQQLSKSVETNDLELKFQHLEKALQDTQKDEIMSLLEKLGRLKSEIEKDEENLNCLKKQRGILRRTTLNGSFRQLEKNIDELKTYLKTTFPYLYSLFHYRKFLSILAVAISKRPPIQPLAKEVSTMKRDLEKGIFKEGTFKTLKKLTRTTYAKDEEVVVSNTRIPSQNSWFDLELLSILEDNMDLNCVVIVDKYNEEDERRNKVQIKTSKSFNTEQRYIYYVNKNHFDVLVPFINQLPFPASKKDSISNTNL